MPIIRGKLPERLFAKKYIFLDGNHIACVISGIRTSIQPNSNKER